MITFKVENKIINIYQEESYPVSSLPVVIYNNVEGTGEDLWQTLYSSKYFQYKLESRNDPMERLRIRRKS